MLLAIFPVVLASQAVDSDGPLSLFLRQTMRFEGIPTSIFEFAIHPAVLPVDKLDFILAHIGTSGERLVSQLQIHGKFASRKQAIDDLWRFNKQDLIGPLSRIHAIGLNFRDYRLRKPTQDDLNQIRQVTLSYLDCASMPLCKYLPTVSRAVYCSILTPQPPVGLFINPERTPCELYGDGNYVTALLAFNEDAELPDLSGCLVISDSVVLFKRARDIGTIIVDIQSGACATLHGGYSLSADESRILVKKDEASRSVNAWHGACVDPVKVLSYTGKGEIGMAFKAQELCVDLNEPEGDGQFYSISKRDPSMVSRVSKEHVARNVYDGKDRSGYLDVREAYRGYKRVELVATRKHEMAQLFCNIVSRLSEEGRMEFGPDTPRKALLWQIKEQVVRHRPPSISLFPLIHEFMLGHAYYPGPMEELILQTVTD